MYKDQIEFVVNEEYIYRERERVPLVVKSST